MRSVVSRATARLMWERVLWRREGKPKPGFMALERSRRETKERRWPMGLAASATALARATRGGSALTVAAHLGEADGDGLLARLDVGGPADLAHGVADGADGH
jgi:hypothetical protein